MIEKRPKLTEALRTFFAAVPAGTIGRRSELPGFWSFGGRVSRADLDASKIIEWVDVCTTCQREVCLILDPTGNYLPCRLCHGHDEDGEND